MIKGKRLSQTDFDIGRRLQSIRKAQRITQKDLALQIGVSFQQLQKYEAGTNRLTLSRALQITKALHISLGSFLKDITDAEAPNVPDLRPEQINILNSFQNISDSELRSIIGTLVRALGKHRETQPEVNPYV